MSRVADVSRLCEIAAHRFRGFHASSPMLAASEARREREVCANLTDDQVAARLAWILKCSHDEHAAIRDDPARWAQLKSIGLQDCDGYFLDLRNCFCGSTIARRVDD